METKAFDKKYAEYYDMFNQGKNYREECDFLETMFKKYSSNEVKSILDLGCGTGLHDLELSKRGYEVTGLDLSENMIEVANSRKNEKLTFHIGDMSNFFLNKKFDACICMFAAFGYLNDNSQIKSAIDCIKSHLNPGGLFIFDAWNGLGVMKELPTSRTKTAQANDLNIIRRSHPTLLPVEHICKVRFDVTVLKDNNLVDSYSEDHNMRFFFPQELKKYLEDAGFQVMEICSAFSPGSSLSENDWNMAIVAKLP